MATPLVSDDVWDLVSPFVPQRMRRYRYPGRRRRPDRACLNGILHVLSEGLAWEDLPQELGYGSGMTCWRRLAEWRTAGVWPKIRDVLRQHLPDADTLDWARAEGDLSIGAAPAAPALAVTVPGAPVAEPTVAR